MADKLAEDHEELNAASAVLPLGLRHRCMEKFLHENGDETKAIDYWTKPQCIVFPHLYIGQRAEAAECQICKQRVSLHAILTHAPHRDLLRADLTEEELADVCPQFGRSHMTRWCQNWKKCLLLQNPLPTDVEKDAYAFLKEKFHRARMSRKRRKASSADGMASPSSPNEGDDNPRVENGDGKCEEEGYQHGEDDELEERRKEFNGALTPLLTHLHALSEDMNRRDDEHAWLQHSLDQHQKAVEGLQSENAYLRRENTCLRFQLAELQQNETRSQLERANIKIQKLVEDYRLASEERDKLKGIVQAMKMLVKEGK
eukprot:m.17745 g.17745  ORF g.17745 m.17745 type:complete len:315 (+) comp27546_c0_seq3:78-1022(+)